eukprot:2659345-Amphidinium_carterae.1
MVLPAPPLGPLPTHQHALVVGWECTLFGLMGPADTVATLTSENVGLATSAPVAWLLAIGLQN